MCGSMDGCFRQASRPQRAAAMQGWRDGRAAMRGAESKRESQKKRIEKKRWRRREVDVWRMKNGDQDARLMQTRRWRRRPSERQRQRQSADGGSSDLAIQAAATVGSSLERPGGRRAAARPFWSGLASARLHCEQLLGRAFVRTQSCACGRAAGSRRRSVAAGDCERQQLR